MGDRTRPDDHPAGKLSGPLTIVGLGPAGLDLLPAHSVELLEVAPRIIARTMQHPAAAELAARRTILACDDLYEAGETFEEVYGAIADRVLEAATEGPVVYAVPGSPLYAERSVSELRRRAAAAGVTVEVRSAPSFLDAVFEALEIDPVDRGFQVLDGRDLPDPLVLHLPTVVFHVDLPVVLDDVVARLARTLPDATPVTVLRDLGGPGADVAAYELSAVPSDAAGLRTSLFLDPPPVGLLGAIAAMRRLRRDCPWDREQTHDSLAPFAVEEVFELVEAIGHLPPGSPDVDEQDFGAYAALEEELGDVLLQVIFHANLAAEATAFDIDDVGEVLRRKLVRRHPHVFGDVEVEDADEVIRNWHRIKSEEAERESLMDGVPAHLPALSRALQLQQRAARVGFDWDSARQVVRDVEEELEELIQVMDDPTEAPDELGDVLFAAVNLARHLEVDPELALRRAVARFERRFRRIEELGDLESADVDEMNRLWERAKQEERNDDAV